MKSLLIFTALMLAACNRQVTPFKAVNSHTSLIENSSSSSWHSTEIETYTDDTISFLYPVKVTESPLSSDVITKLKPKKVLTDGRQKVFLIDVLKDDPNSKQVIYSGESIEYFSIGSGMTLDSFLNPKLGKYCTYSVSDPDQNGLQKISITRLPSPEKNPGCFNWVYSIFKKGNTVVYYNGGQDCAIHDPKTNECLAGMMVNTLRIK